METRLSNESEELLQTRGHSNAIPPKTRHGTSFIQGVFVVDR